MITLSEPPIDYASVFAELRDDFLDAAREQLDELAAMHGAGREGNTDPAPVFEAFLRSVHNLKGQGSSFGFPSISMIAHMLESRLASSTPEVFGESGEVLPFIDRMAAIVEARIEPDEKELQTILASLESGPASERETLAAAPRVVIIAGSNTVGEMVRFGLEEEGFNVTAIPDPFEALSYIVRSMPKAVVCTAEIPGLSGLDLVHALTAMPVTRQVRTALITSRGPEDLRVKSLPATTLRIQVGPDMSAKLAEAFADLKAAPLA